MKRDFILNGVRIGEYDFIPETAKDEIQKRCIEKGMNYVEIDLGKSSRPAEDYVLELAKFLAENKVYFVFNTARKDVSVGFDSDFAEKIKEVSGEYYLANEFGEVGTRFSCKGSAYGKEPFETNADSMTEGKRHLTDKIKEIADLASNGKTAKIAATEPTALITYHAECDTVDYPILEAMCGNPEIMIPVVRGAQRAFEKDFFGTYIAHEWYGGTRNFDMLKRKRLKMAYDYSYMSGSSLLILESGDLFLESHDAHNYEKRTVDDSEICENYRKVISDFAKLVKEDFRPAGGPRVKIAFIQGNLDGYSPWRGGSSLWNQWSREEYGYGEAEFTWRILDDIASKRSWADTHNFGIEDFSSAPAYGMYDIIPATASAEAMKKYDYLIFTGWNTMTDEIYENLKSFVKGGGRLFMCAAHLNTNGKRDGKICLINGGKVGELFGCTLDSENSYCVNDGYKFKESIVPGILYPASRDFDPLFSEGYASYARAELSGGVCSAMLTQSFLFNEEDYRSKPAVIENKYGEGYTILHTGLDYPSGALYPVYRTIVREIMQASHRAADIKVACSDKVRFSVYEGNKMYFLNTDFDCKSYAKITHNGKTTELTLDPCEFKIMEKV